MFDEYMLKMARDGHRNYVSPSKPKIQPDAGYGAEVHWDGENLAAISFQTPVPDYNSSGAQKPIGYSLIISGLNVQYGPTTRMNISADGKIDVLLEDEETEIEFSGTVGDFIFERVTYNIAKNQITYLVFVKFDFVGYSTVLVNPWFTINQVHTDTLIQTPQLSGILYYDESGPFDIPPNTYRYDIGTITVVPIYS